MRYAILDETMCNDNSHAIYINKCKKKERKKKKNT